MKWTASRLSERLDSLIEKGESVVRTWRGAADAPAVSNSVNVEMLSEWRIQSLNLLCGLFGPEHVYQREFQALSMQETDRNSVLKGIGLLRALREDVDSGNLSSFATLVSAEVFSEFLEMAKYLLDQAYKDAAASILGAVLEDFLRRLALDKGLPVSRSDGIDSLNQKLARSQIYNAVVHKRIDVWRQMRNSADHGRFADYASIDVQEMHRGIEDLIATHMR
jgi:hypothetical protein